MKITESRRKKEKKLIDGRGDQQRNSLAGCAEMLDYHRGQEALEEKAAALENQVFKDNPNRYHQLQFVRSFIVHASCLFKVGKHLLIRHCLS